VRFHEEHRVQNGFARQGDPIEVVTARAVALGAPALTWADLDEVVPVGEPRRASREVLVGSSSIETDVWWRPALAAGAEVTGPAVVEEPEATVWIGPGERAVVHSSGALEVQW
jgi:N-methylhydantoinase A